MSPADTYSVADIAARFGVKAHTVLAGVKSGELVALNVARSVRAKRPSWRITKESLSAFEAARRTAGMVPVSRKTRRAKCGSVIEFY